MIVVLIICVLFYICGKRGGVRRRRINYVGNLLKFFFMFLFEGLIDERVVFKRLLYGFLCSLFF